MRVFFPKISAPIPVSTAVNPICSTSMFPCTSLFRQHQLFPGKKLPFHIKRKATPLQFLFRFSFPLIGRLQTYPLFSRFLLTTQWSHNHVVDPLFTSDRICGLENTTHPIFFCSSLGYIADNYQPYCYSLSLFLYFSYNISSVLSLFFLFLPHLYSRISRVMKVLPFLFFIFLST